MRDEPLKGRFVFSVSLRFELFYALEALHDPHTRLHPEWRALAHSQLPSSFRETVTALGNWPRLWVVVADVLRSREPGHGFDALKRAIAELPPAEFQRQVLLGALHDDKVVDNLVSGRWSVTDAISKLPATKREWLDYFGLYPPSPESAGVRALSTLCLSPRQFQNQVVSLITVFWRRVFEKTWRTLEPELRRSVAEKERLFHSCALDEFARVALLRIEIDAKKRQFCAIRGGYRLPFNSLHEARVLPSAFNGNRYWSAFEAEDGTTCVYLPCFDPAVTLVPAGAPARTPDSELDPALICRALGDGTRFAIAGLLAHAPQTSAELASALGVSRPTISHHVFLLREAGLLDEEHQSGSIRLSLRRATIASLSDLAMARLFG